MWSMAHREDGNLLDNGSGNGLLILMETGLSTNGGCCDDFFRIGGIVIVGGSADADWPGTSLLFVLDPLKSMVGVRNAWNAVTT